MNEGEFDMSMKPSLQKLHLQYMDDVGLYSARIGACTSSIVSELGNIYLKAAYDCASKVNAQPFIESGLKGKAIGDAIHKKRIETIAKNQTSWLAQER